VGVAPLAASAVSPVAPYSTSNPARTTLGTYPKHEDC